MSVAIAESLKPASKEQRPTSGGCNPRGYASPRDEDQDGEGTVVQDDLVLDSATSNWCAKAPSSRG